MKTAIEGLQQIINSNELRLKYLSKPYGQVQYENVEAFYLQKQVIECKEAIKVLRSYDRAMQWEDN